MSTSARSPTTHRSSADELLHETGVALAPGVDFDQARGHHFVRLSFAGDEGQVAEAGARLCAWFRSASPMVRQAGLSPLAVAGA